MLIYLVCSFCSEHFQFDSETFKSLDIRAIPRHCPTCNDRRQKRPATAVVTERKCLSEFEPVRICLPPELFSKYQAEGRDIPCLRAILKGSMLGNGVSWSGRLDIFCLHSSLPEVGRVRVMEVIHEKAQEHGIVEMRDGEDDDPSPIRQAIFTYSPAYMYMVIEPTTEESEPTMSLVAAKVGYKTTLKGIGKQWHASLDSSTALWSRNMQCSARSGRFGAYGCVAVVDRDHPIVARQWGDVQSEEWFPPEAGPELTAACREAC